MSAELRREQRPKKVFTPAGLTDMLNYYRDHPRAVPFAGGTYLLLTRDLVKNQVYNELIETSRVPELNHISRTERYMEIGAAVPISRILRTGRHVMPRALYSALSQIGGPALRNQATLGGNLCSPEHRLSIYPILLLLDVRLELRRSGGSRWVNLNRFINSEGRPIFEAGELLTRIRIPFLSWDVEEFRQQERIFSSDHFIFCGIASRQKEILSDLRTCFCLGNKQVIRARNVEAELIGRRLPLPEDDRRETALILQHQIERNHPDLDPFQAERIRRNMNWFMQRLNESI